MNPDLAFIEELSLSSSDDGGSVTRPWCSAQHRKMGPIHSWMKHQWLSWVFQHTGCPTMEPQCLHVTVTQGCNMFGSLFLVLVSQSNHHFSTYIVDARSFNCHRGCRRVQGYVLLNNSHPGKPTRSAAVDSR